MKCKICQSKSIQKCFVIKPIENPASYFQSLEVQYFQCDFCHFLFSDIFDQLSECEMRNMNIKLHDTAYYAVIDPVAFRINRGYRELEMVSNYLKLQGIPKASCKVLVFGCGQGLSFNLMLQQGFDVYATDCDACDFRSVPLPGQVSAAQWLAVLKNQLINLAVRKKISKKCYDKGLANEMHERFLFQGALHNRRFGIVTMTEVMEHLIDPLETMVAITEIVEHGGFVIGTTGFVDYAESPLEKWWYIDRIVNSGHISILSLKAFRILCQKLNAIGSVYRGGSGIQFLIGDTLLSPQQGVFVIHKPDVI